jgi:hypothetical protein
MSDPTYGGGPYEGSGGGYSSGSPGYQPPGYGGQQYGGPYQQPTGPATGGYPQQAGYPAPGGPALGGPALGGPALGGPALGGPVPGGPVPAARMSTDRLGLAAQIVTIVGYVCAVAGLIGFILLLTVDIGSAAYRFASALQALSVGLGLGALNFAAGTWLASRTVPR